MRNILSLFTVLLIAISCGPSKQKVAISSEDKLMENAVKDLEKSPSSKDLAERVQHLYKVAKTAHQNQIDAYGRMTDISRFDKILAEYNALQRLYTIIHKSSAAQKVVVPISYSAEIDVLKEQAAEAYYNRATRLMENAPDKLAYREAFALLRKVNGYIPQYKNTSALMEVASRNSVLHVVIHPVGIDQKYIQGTDFRNTGQFNGQLLSAKLVEDLGGESTDNKYARYFTSADARRRQIQADWEVDLTWVNIDIPRPSNDREVKNTSIRVQTGKDSTGKPVYETVTGKLTIITQNLKAAGNLEVLVTTTPDRQIVHSKRNMARMQWANKYADYTGDRRALDEQDLQLVNNPIKNPPVDDILGGLYYDIYFQIKSNIENLVKTAK